MWLCSTISYQTNKTFLQDFLEILKHDSGCLQSDNFNFICEFIFQNCTEAKALAPGTSNAVKISRFFDKVSQGKNVV